MNRTKILWVGLAMLALSLTACAVPAAVAPQTSPSPEARIILAPTPQLPSGAPPLPIGAPAITPTLPGQIPAYTIADATNYVKTHPLPGTINQDQNSTIVDVEFVTSAVVSKRLSGESTGYPDDAILCYVQLQGKFVFAGPQGTQVEYPVGVENFDAQTGNLVLISGLPTSPLSG